MVRCIQEEKRMEEQEIPMLKEETIPGLNSKERLNQRVEEKYDVTIAIKQATHKRHSHSDDDQNPSQGNQRNGRSNGKGKRSVGNQGRG